MAKKLGVDIRYCGFNMDKGMWETLPEYWVYHVHWVMVAFPTITDLDRGVSA
jgi:hypothetical protein